MQLKIDLQIRIEEVEMYFAFAKEIDSIETHKHRELKIEPNIQITVKRDLQKVIRANCYLILYNLIESTIRNGIWTICDYIEDEMISYKDLSKQIQAIWISEKAYEINEISNQMKAKGYIKKLIEEQIGLKGITISKNRISLSGNLDYKTIDRLINDYGFHGKITERNKSKLNKTLLRIKHERNALAHGNKSFRHVAEIITIQELFDYKDTVISFLNDVNENMIKFIEIKGFKRS